MKTELRGLTQAFAGTAVRRRKNNHTRFLQHNVIMLPIICFDLHSQAQQVGAGMITAVDS